MDTNALTNPALTRHVDDLWPSPRSRDELIAVAESVSALKESPGWRAIVNVIEEELEALESQLGNTRTALAHADYALLHGRRGGLRAIFDAGEAILSRAREAAVEIDNQDAAEPATV